MPDADKEENSDPETSETEIEVELGALSVSVSNHDHKIAEAQFQRVWEYVTDDAGEWSEAMRARLTNYQ